MSFFRRRKKWLAAALLLLLLLGAVRVAWSFRPDPRVARVENLGRQLTGDAGRNLPPEQRRQQWQAFREEMRQLTPEQRRQAGEKIFADRRRQRREAIERYFKMSRQEQRAYLDNEINRMETMRRQRQAAGTGAGQNGNGPPGSWGNGGNRPSAAERDRMRERRLDASTPEEHAQATEFYRQLNARRQQLGLPARGGRGGR